jgi:hypothetical protein
MLHLGETDDMFVVRFGWPYSGPFPTRGEVEELRKRIMSLSVGTRIELSRRELMLLVRSLSELANGAQIQEWEFHTLIGVERDRVRDLLDVLHRHLVSIVDNGQGRST